MHEHGTKTTLVFLLADGEASWSLLPSSVSLLSGGTVQPENTYSRILKVTGQVWESQKMISINTNHSYLQRSSRYASLNWSNNTARFSFNQSNRKRWGAKLVDVKHLPHLPPKTSYLLKPLMSFFGNQITTAWSITLLMKPLKLCYLGIINFLGILTTCNGNSCFENRKLSNPFILIHSGFSKNFSIFMTLQMYAVVYCDISNI